jgi:two-component system response regulator RegA
MTSELIGTMNKRIETALLVDDDDAFRMTLQLALRRRGVKARTAATVREGLIALEDEPVDLIILDNRMPQGDGLSALAEYRDKHPTAVILILTGFGDIPLAVAAVRRGADAFLSKPIDADRLLREAQELREQGSAARSAPRPRTTLNLEHVERDTISAALEQSGGVVGKAAKLLGIDRRTLQRKLKKLS